MGDPNRCQLRHIGYDKNTIRLQCFRVHVRLRWTSCVSRKSWELEPWRRLHKARSPLKDNTNPRKIQNPHQDVNDEVVSGVIYMWAVGPYQAVESRRAAFRGVSLTRRPTPCREGVALSPRTAAFDATQSPILLLPYSACDTRTSEHLIPGQACNKQAKTYPCTIISGSADQNKRRSGGECQSSAAAECHALGWSASHTPGLTTCHVQRRRSR